MDAGAVDWDGTRDKNSRGGVPSGRELPHSIKMVGGKPMSLGKGRDMALEALGVVRSRHTAHPHLGSSWARRGDDCCPWIVGVTDRGVSGEALIDATAAPADPGLASASQSRRSKRARWAA
jgi:hypothetical protein